MQKLQNFFGLFISMVLCAVLLSACGGGGGGGGGGVVGGGGGGGNAPDPEPEPEPPPPIYALGPTDGPLTEAEVNTAEYRRNYGLRNIKADAAYREGYFGQGITIGIIESGFDTTHSDLAGNVVPGWNYITTNTMITPDRHGTAVAGVIAAARNRVGIHGVAPEAKIMPLEITLRFFGPSDNEVDIYTDDRTSNVRIFNHSYGLPALIPGRWNGVAITTVPYLKSVIDQDQRFSQLFSNIVAADAARQTDRDEDAVYVWSAGNGWWNPVTGLSQRLPDLLRNGTFVPDPISGFTSDEIKAMLLADLVTLPVSGVSDLNWLPAYQPELLGRFVAVVATDQNDKIARFSNGCGEAMSWCIAAPGVNITTTAAGGGVDGTSFSAPHVSGVLGVLSSRMPSMPMSIVVTLMLETATERRADLNRDGVPDEVLVDGLSTVYGHGLVNISNAIAGQNSAAMPRPGASSGARVLGTKARFSGALRGLENKLASLSAVVTTMLPSIPYYTMPLSRFAEAEEKPSRARGHAAEDMLSPSGEVEMLEGASAFFSPRTGEFVKAAYDGGQWGRLEYQMCPDCETSVWGVNTESVARPSFIEDGEAVNYRLPLGERLVFYAAAGLDEDAQHGTYNQYGLQWRDGSDDGKPGWSVDVSRIDEKEGLLGSDFSGALAVGDTRLWQSRWGTQFQPIDSWTFAAFYDLGRIDSDSNFGSGGVITDISEAWFDGWKVQLEGEDLFRDNDLLRLQVEQQTTVQSGSMGINHSALDEEGGYEILHTRIGLRADEIYIGRLGYRYSPMDGMDIAVGLEYADSGNNGDDAAASFALRWIF